MDPDKLNCQLIETVITRTVAGENSFLQQDLYRCYFHECQRFQLFITSYWPLLSLSLHTGISLFIPMHSALTTQEQSEVFKKREPGVHKIILSTNITDTSLTTNDCVFVVNCCKMEEKGFDPNRNMKKSLDGEIVSSNCTAKEREYRACDARCLYSSVHEISL
jgi:hypothetical protein